MGRAWLSLEGTILSLREHAFYRKTTVDIPLELISISEEKRFRARWLIAALLCALAGLLMGTGVYYLFTFPNNTVPEWAPDASAIVVMSLWGILLAGLAIRFLFRDWAISLDITPDSVVWFKQYRIAFWLNGRQKSTIQMLVKDIRKRKHTVDRTVPYPLPDTAGDATEHPGKRAVFSTFLFATPFLVTRIPWLLFVCIIPVSRYLYSLLRLSREPPLFRRAVKHAMNHDWNQMRALAEKLLEREPDYLPGRGILIEALVRCEEFDRARTELDAIRDDLEPDEVESFEDDIILRKGIAERKRISVKGLKS